MIDHDSADNGSDRNEGGDGPPPDTTPTLSVDEILGILSDRYRRELLYYFVDEDVVVARLDAVLDRLKKRDASRHGLRPDRNDLQLSLLHIHLPKLADIGLVEYDERNRELRYHRHHDVEDWLEFTRQHEP